MMVKEIAAFETSDGKVHKTHREALKAETFLTLERIGRFQVATINGLLENAIEIAPILSAYADAIRADSKDTK